MKNDILIAYYSWSGNTRKIAERIRRETGGTLFEIKPVRPYTTNYNAAVEQAKDEIEAGFKPELMALPEITLYTTIFLGSPIWWHTMAPPLASFTYHLNMGSRIVAPFYTNGSGGGGAFEKDIAKMCPDATVKAGFGVYNSGGRETTVKISSWLRSIGL
jgi:flavodoxin